jgi:hypothetical protein
MAKTTDQIIDKMASKGREILTHAAQSFLDGSEEKLRQARMMEFVGAALALGQLAQSLSAQTIKAWETFQQQEGYKAYGCKTWVDFLENHPAMGLTKNQYYDRKNLLDKEGEELFDLLNAINAPAYIRKQLSAGDVTLDGDTLVIADKRVPMNDAKGIKKALAKVVEQMERLEESQKKSERENEKLKKKLEDATRPVEVGGRSAEHTDPAHQALLRLVAGFTQLEAELSDLPAEVVASRVADYRPYVEHAMERLMKFFNEQSAQTGADDKQGLRKRALSRYHRGQQPADVEDDDHAEVSDEELAAVMAD